MSSLKNNFWKTPDELEHDPAVLQFISHRIPDHEEIWGDGASRRGFMQIMGASLALAGVTSVAGCRWEKDEIVPLADRPEDWVPGVPKKYSSALELGGVATSVVVTSYDGRPIKVDGNPAHPNSGAGSTGFTQASILEMYDPDRSRGIRRSEGKAGIPASWLEFEQWAKTNAAEMAAKAGAGLRILSEAGSSLTLQALWREMTQSGGEAKFPQAKWHEYEPLSRDNERLGNQMALGAPFRTHLQLAKANVIACFDADLFADHPEAVRLNREFAQRRDPDTGPMNRLYVLESTFSLTGAMSDHRLPVRSRHIKACLLGLEALLSGQNLAAIGAEVLKDAALAKYLEVLAKDLTSARAAGLVVVGPRQPAELHAIAAKINGLLGAAGQSVTYTRDADRPHHIDDITALVKDMQAGAVETLIILGGNPVYNAPANLGFAAALAKVKQSVHLSLYDDETSALSNWHVPRAHALEAWSDGRSYNGTLTLGQPIVEPLYAGRTAIDVLKLWTSKANDASEKLIQATAAGLGMTTWKKALHDGFVPGTELTAEAPAVQAFSVAPLKGDEAGADVTNGQLELVFLPSTSAYDGRFANNAWLQELPDFLTKVTWDNCLLIAPATARALKIKHQTMVKVKVGGSEIEAAAYVMPGQAKFSCAIALGYGRTRAGTVGGDESRGVPGRGFDSYKLRTSAEPYIATGVTLTSTSKIFEFGNTQDHFDMDKRGAENLQARVKDLIKEATVKEYADNGSGVVTAAAHIEASRVLLRPETAEAGVMQEGDKTRPIDMWDKHEYSGPAWEQEVGGYKWGMSIDLGKCTGCNSCMVACQAENNIPVVGKDQVIKNREMHWIRIDRYFAGDMDNPEVVHQPVACQQCENAPCEQVCPVAATIHTTEGLNDMVYNRCVGTKYCANNCPYKVRRFNFLRWDWYKQLDEARNKVRSLLFNPEVTVRSRGVMEKCTYCVQRIQNARIRTKAEAQGTGAPRRLVDGEVTSACQDACPADAIQFGDLNDQNSKVRLSQKSNRAYSLLGDLNTRPRTAYLTRIRNPHPELV